MKEEVAAARSGRTASRLVVVFLRCELTNRVRLVASPPRGTRCSAWVHVSSPAGADLGHAVSFFIV